MDIFRAISVVQFQLGFAYLAERGFLLQQLWALSEHQRAGLDAHTALQLLPRALETVTRLGIKCSLGVEKALFPQESCSAC